MGVKVTVDESIDKRAKYPRLKKSVSTGNIVLFTSRHTGMCLHATGSTIKGDYSGSWDETGFEPFKGTLTLSNE